VVTAGACIDASPVVQLGAIKELTMHAPGLADGIEMRSCGASLGLHQQAHAAQGAAVVGAAWGLLRVAAAEFPSTRWAALDSDPVARMPTPDVYLSSTNDEYGCATRGGVWLQPQLAALEVDGSGSIPSQRGSVLVTGGLGDLGLLVCAWLTQRGGAAAHVWLVGRSGRAPAWPASSSPQVYPSSAITAVRCDAGCADETGTLVAAASAIQSVLHSGGVLQVTGVAGSASLRASRGRFAAPRLP
jgi:yersiniabactin nonribosomal peptide/polyketide synthase